MPMKDSNLAYEIENQGKLTFMAAYQDAKK